MYQKRIFKCSSEVSWLLTLKFGTKGEIVVINSSMALKWKKSNYTGCPIEKGINKKFLFGAAQGFNSQFLDLFGFYL